MSWEVTPARLIEGAKRLSPDESGIQPGSALASVINWHLERAAMAGASSADAADFVREGFEELIGWASSILMRFEKSAERRDQIERGAALIVGKFRQPKEIIDKRVDSC